MKLFKRKADTDEDTFEDAFDGGFGGGGYADDGDDGFGDDGFGDDGFGDDGFGATDDDPFGFEASGAPPAKRPSRRTGARRSATRATEVPVLDGFEEPARDEHVADHAAADPLAFDPLAVEPVAVEPPPVEPLAVEPLAVEPVAVEPVDEQGTDAVTDAGTEPEEVGSITAATSTVDADTTDADMSPRRTDDVGSDVDTFVDAAVDTGGDTAGNADDHDDPTRDHAGASSTIDDAGRAGWLPPASDELAGDDDEIAVGAPVHDDDGAAAGSAYAHDGPDASGAVDAGGADHDAPLARSPIDLDGPLEDSPFAPRAIAGDPLVAPPAGDRSTEVTNEPDAFFGGPPAATTDADADADGAGDGPDEPGGAAFDGPTPAKGRSRAMLVIGVAALVVVASVIAFLSLNSKDSPKQSGTIIETTTTEVSTTGLAPTTSATPSSATLAGAVLPTTAATSTVTVTAAPSTAPHTEVTTLQVVPVIRNVIVVVNGHSYASAADGTIVLAVGDRHSDVQIVGLNTVPALQQAQFTAWGDGDTRSTRPLDSLDGPLAQIGFNVLDRVQVVAGTTPYGGATVTFSSSIGSLDLQVGQPQWVVATRAVPTSAGLMPEQISYTAVQLNKDTVISPLQPLEFQAQPEAIWSVLGA